MTDNKLEVIPLGGVGLFGMNMMAMRCGNEAIIIDAGMGVPEQDLPGVDIVIPDFLSSLNTAMRFQPSPTTGTKPTSARCLFCSGRLMFLSTEPPDDGPAGETSCASMALWT